MDARVYDFHHTVIIEPISQKARELLSLIIGQNLTGSLQFEVRMTGAFGKKVLKKFNTAGLLFG